MQTDYQVAKGELSDPALLEARAEEALKKDHQFVELEQQLKNAREDQSGGSKGLVDSINRKIEQYRADFKKKMVQEMQNKPNVPLQQLTQRFKIQFASVQQQLAVANKSFEQKKNELQKRVEKSVDLETRGEELKKLQQTANDMSLKLEGLDIDVAGPEQTRQASIENQKLADNWPAGVAFPSPKEGEITARMWHVLGLKVVPATKQEQASKYGRAVKVLGGPDKSQIFLLSIGGHEINDYDDLDSALTSVSHKDNTIIKYVIDDSEHGPSWIDFVSGVNSSSTSHPEGKTRPSKFPSLEDQKLADLAYKCLQLELEPIGADDLKRVQALGYDGGVKVMVAQNKSSNIEPADILVGLHVWPTTSMKEVSEILYRDDRAELNRSNTTWCIARRSPTAAVALQS